MLFNDKDVVCFLGDSLTALGYWMAEVYQEIKKTTDIKCYNCSVSGGTAYRAEGYLYSNCLIHNPDWVVVMFALNDIDIAAYDPENSSPDKEKRIREAMDRYKLSYENIIKKIQSFGARVIVGIPIPYDEISDSDTKNYKCMKGFEETIAYAKKLAKQYDCPVVDFDREFRPRYPDSAIMRADRVHPTVHGFHIMAQTFLRDTGYIAECDFDSEFVFEDWNKKRYDAEQALHYSNYVQLCALYDPSNPMADKDELMQKAKNHLTLLSDRNSYEARCYREYIERYPHKDAYMSEIIKLTI